jgi:hypothetical protein
MIKKRADLEITSWKEHSGALRGRRGVYVLYVNKVCLYVGASSDLYNRVARFLGPSYPETGMANELLEAVLRHYKNRRPRVVKKVKIFFHRGPLARLELSYIKRLGSKLNFNKTYRFD